MRPKSLLARLRTTVEAKRTIEDRYWYARNHQCDMTINRSQLRALHISREFVPSRLGDKYFGFGITLCCEGVWNGPQGFEKVWCTDYD